MVSEQSMFAKEVVLAVDTAPVAIDAEAIPKPTEIMVSCFSANSRAGHPTVESPYFSVGDPGPAGVAM
jgi:hypothetical protein